MKDLIEALTILLKYGNPKHPTSCEHDELHVDIDPAKISVEDIMRLDALGFSVDEESKGFVSYRFGSY